VPIGLPSDLARRRPDIRQAEANLHAATAEVGVAVSDYFPQLTLTAAGGYQSVGLSRLIETASRFASFGPAIELPIFQGGRLRATVRLQRLKAREAAVIYAQTVLTALNQVENALAAYASDQARHASLQTAVTASRNARQLARQRYQSGVASFIDVLDAERSEEQNEVSLADATTAVSADLVQLYRALGGGWESSNGADQVPTAAPAKANGATD
jgi:NodT family efflux transporter outer membrane factor (OMF) lipoprotein